MKIAIVGTGYVGLVSGTCLIHTMIFMYFLSFILAFSIRQKRDYFSSAPEITIR